MRTKKKQENGTEKQPKVLTAKSRKRRKIIRCVVKIAAVLLVIVIGVNIVMRRMQKSITASNEVSYTVEKAERRDISTVLSGSGTVEPLNIYNITTLVKGEIIAADFEEGDTVEEGDVLYRLTTDEVDSFIETAQKSVTRAESSYEKAVKSLEKAQESLEEAQADMQEKQEAYDKKLKDYNDALAVYDDLNVTSQYAGVVTKLYVEEGDNISEKGKIADIYDDSTMTLVVPFHASDVTNDWIGKEAEVEVSGSFEVLNGTVTNISQATSVLTGNQIVKNVTIRVKNPGSITTSSEAAATIDGIEGQEEGMFTVGLETTLVSTKSGGVGTIYIEEGSSVSVGSRLIAIDADSVEDAVSSYENALTSAENALESAKKSVESAETSVTNAQDSIDSANDTLEDADADLEEQTESLEDCQITSPITGIVVAKNMLVGDIIGTSNFSSTLATIYDISAVTFEMEIDELDIKSVKVGQQVNVTADALDDTVITGVITNVSLVSTTSGGVTQYPVTVRIDDVGKLLTGMNVTGEIVLEGVENVVSVPVDAIKRGNVVYVKDDTVTEADGDVPAGFRAVTVETGMSDGDYIEITSGLAEGAEVYVSRNASGTTAMTGFGMGGFNAGDQSGSMQGERPSGNGGGMQGGQGMPGGR